MNKEQKIEFLRKLKNGEAKLEDLLKGENISLDGIFFSAKRRDTIMEKEIQAFENLFPGKPYVVLKIVRRGE